MYVAHDKLSEISEQIQSGQTPEKTTVREFLSWFDAQRRGQVVVSHIRHKLKTFELVTFPDFEYAYIDQAISFRPLVPEEAESEAELQPLGMPRTDPTYRIGKLHSANQPPLSVKPDAGLEEAITLMLSNDYSQLPVMTTDRDVKGMISWSSIGSRLALGRQCSYVRDCMDQHVEISADTSLFDAIDTIVANQYVLIRSSDQLITGIVTTSDLSQQFRQLGEPFLLLGEIENYIRRMIQDRFDSEDLAQARDPADRERVVETAADLTFGEYLRLLEKPDKWSNLRLSIDRVTFVKQLEAIRNIRNDVMHFDPDGISPEDLDTLRLFVGFMQDLANIGVI